MLIAAIVLIKFINGGGGGVPVPNVAGDSVPKAEAALTHAGFTVAGVEKKYNSSTAKGQVIGTSPAYGSTEPKGHGITIIESNGTKTTTVAVPSVVGDRRGQAVSILKQHGFQVAVVAVTSAGSPSNTVVSEKPSGTAPKGSTVTIGVTAKALTVPNVIGMTQQEAEKTLGASPYGYFVTPQPGAGPGGYAVGSVYATSPRVGSALPAGSPITIYVVESPTSSPPASSSPPTSPSPSPSTSDTTTTPPPGQGTTGQGASSQDSPSAGTPGKNANGPVNLGG
jgi:eukaryotic-like serine/threonine-protein kinase